MINKAQDNHNISMACSLVLAAARIFMKYYLRLKQVITYTNKPFKKNLYPLPKKVDFRSPSAFPR